LEEEEEIRMILDGRESDLLDEEERLNRE